MIIFGNKYTLEPFEKKILKKKYKNITHLKMTDLSNNKDNQDTILENAIIQEIKNCIKLQKQQNIILNLEHKVSYKIIDLLVTLDLQGAKIFTYGQFCEIFLKKCFIPSKQEYERLEYITDFRHLTGIKKLTKHLLSYILSIIILICVIPVLLIAAFIIKTTSTGNIIFKQKRVGLNSKNFDCFKFRSMYVNNESERPYTTEDDDRITPIGKFMRKTRIDELPQIYNVLKGDMFLAGPRTEWDILVDQYQEKIPFYKLRHLVKPGITGWAQVNYPYGQNEFDARQKLMYDLYYIKNWSIFLDIQIYWKTILIVLGRKGM